MLCQKPFINKETGLEHGCGTCLPCRLNRRKIWTTRLFLESCFHSSSFFVTLTYSEETLPTPPYLKRGDLVEFRDVLQAFYPAMRYFMVGEYGKRNLRPHYHALLYSTSLSKAGLDFIWRKGFTDLSPCNVATAAYVAGYIGDKMENWQYADNQPVPFAIQSPGLGSSALPRLEAIVRSAAGQRYLETHGDVPQFVRFQGKVWPLGRYLTEKVRKACGIDNKEERQLSRLEEEKLIRDTPELFDERENRRLVARDRSAAWHRRRREKLKL